MKKLMLVIFLGISVIALFYACTKDASNSNSSALSAGKNGSLTRFTVSGNFLYAVDNHFLYTYNLSNPQAPLQVAKTGLNFDIETIYPYKNSLFLGTKTGLYIYSIDTPSHPSLIGEAKHARSCDPVVANDSVAYVTLKGNGSCGPATSGLYIHDVKNLLKPILKNTIPLTDPEGMGIQDSALYVCCNNAGLKVFNIKSGFDPKLKITIVDGIYKDVIPYNGILICYVTSGILLYDISNPMLPILVNKINN